MQTDLRPSSRTLNSHADAGPGAVQGMPLTDPARAQGVQLPALDRLTGLTALNLSENTVEEVPPCLSKLTALRFLDLSLNHMLRVRPLDSHATYGRQYLGSHTWPLHVLASCCSVLCGREPLNLMYGALTKVKPVSALRAGLPEICMVTA